MERAEANRDLEFIRRVVERASLRIDAHGFHNVHWGIIVLVWYPLANVFERLGDPMWQIPLGIVAVALGSALSWWRETVLSRRPRLPGENVYLTGQVKTIVAGCIAAGVLLSFLMPATGFIAGRNVPVLWGLVYANLAFMTGVVINRDFLVSGVVIFAGVVAALLVPHWNGCILGPFMGIGMIVPGLRAERRVRDLGEEQLAGQRL